MKLAEKDLEERKRMLQNILNVLCCHEDIIKEKLFREVDSFICVVFGRGIELRI